ncbi:MAG: DNA gyrase inhibitor YacG [Hyphomicrobium sp.]|jgi:hypothetical protein
MVRKEPQAGVGGRCPICGAPTEVGFRPFCSKRCRDVDLARWLGGGYAIAGNATDEEDGDSPLTGDGRESDSNEDDN